MLEAFYIVAGIASIVGIAIPLYVLYQQAKRRRGVSWSEAFRVAEGVLTQIEQSGWRPDIVVGIGRSGALWAGWMAGNLGSLPVAVVDKKYSFDAAGRGVVFPVGAEVVATVLSREDLKTTGARKLCVLVVEGATSNGSVLEEVRRQFSSTLEACEVRFAILYKNKVVTQHIDYVGKVETDHWPQRLPWHHRPAYQRRLDATGGVPMPSQINRP